MKEFICKEELKTKIKCEDFERLKEICLHKHSDMCGDWFGGKCELDNCHRLSERENEQ